MHCLKAVLCLARIFGSDIEDQNKLDTSEPVVRSAMAFHIGSHTMRLLERILLHYNTIILNVN